MSQNYCWYKVDGETMQPCMGYFKLGDHLEGENYDAKLIKISKTITHCHFIPVPPSDYEFKMTVLKRLEKLDEKISQLLEKVSP